MWHEDSGVNYTLSAAEVDEIIVTKLENMTLRVVTAKVCIYDLIYIQNICDNSKIYSHRHDYDNHTFF